LRQARSVVLPSKARDRLRHSRGPHILKDKMPFVLSGVNRGQNVAEDVTYSGTVAGAIEGAILASPRSRYRRPMAPRRGKTRNGRRR